MELRIAYMTGEYPRVTDTFIQREVDALRRHGVQVDTFSVRKPSRAERVEDAQVDGDSVGTRRGRPERETEVSRTFYLLPAGPWAFLKSHATLLARSPRRYVAALWTGLRVRPPGLKALVWQLAYFAEAGLVAHRMRDRGLIHLHNHFSNSSCSVAMLAAQLGGFTFSFTMHGPSEFFEPKYWRIDEKIRRALFVCCISQFCRGQAMIFAPREKWDRLHVVHCGVDPRQFAPVHHEGDGHRLLFVGRLAAVKGMPILLEAVALLRTARPDIRLTLAGDGPDRESLQALARRLEIEDHVRFLGYQSQAQVRELLERTDVFAMASFAEGVPVVLMEAMASGVPVVATRIAGIPELVEHGRSGFLVAPGDARELAGCIDELLSSAEFRNRFGVAGRDQVAREFNLRDESDRLVQILTGALEGRVAAVRPEVAKADQARAIALEPAAAGE